MRTGDRFGINNGGGREGIPRVLSLDRTAARSRGNTLVWNSLENESLHAGDVAPACARVGLDAGGCARKPGAKKWTIKKERVAENCGGRAMENRSGDGGSRGARAGADTIKARPRRCVRKR